MFNTIHESVLLFFVFYYYYIVLFFAFVMEKTKYPRGKYSVRWVNKKS